MFQCLALVSDSIKKFSFVAFACMAVVTPIAPGQTALAVATSQAQGEPATVLPVFDVASIRQNKNESAQRQILFTADGDGPTISNLTLSQIIQYAYNVSGPLSGTPAWAKEDRYDIRAKVASTDITAYHKLTIAQRRLMLQGLLEERFKLKVHSESSEIAVYALEVSKRGTTMTQAKADDPHPNGPKKADGTPLSGSICPYSSNSLGELNCQATTMPALANMLSAVGHTGRHVVDKTDLTGTYDFILKWTPAQTDATDPNGDSGQDGTQSLDAAGTSIFEAVQKQLGLKLEPAKDLLEGLAVDHLERPPEN